MFHGRCENCYKYIAVLFTHWMALLEGLQKFSVHLHCTLWNFHAGGVSVLADLLKIENTSLHLVTTHVLCNISCYPPVCEALTKANATPTLVHLLNSPDIDVQSQLAIVLSDLGQIPGNQKAIAAEGAVSALIKMLDYSYEGILVNAVNTIRVLCNRNVANQMEAGKGGAIPPLVEFLSVSSGMLLYLVSRAFFIKYVFIGVRSFRRFSCCTLFSCWSCSSLSKNWLWSFQGNLLTV